MRELFLKDKKIRLVAGFIASIIFILFGIYNILFVASDRSLVCISTSKTCTIEDKALLKKDITGFTFNQILSTQVKANCSSKSGTCNYTTQLITSDKSYDIITGKNQAEEQAYADQINIFTRSQNITGSAETNGVNTPNLAINYNNWSENAFGSLIIIIISVLFIFYGMWRFNKNSIW